MWRGGQFQTDQPLQGAETRRSSCMAGFVLFSGKGFLMQSKDGENGNAVLPVRLWTVTGQAPSEKVAEAAFFS